MDYAIVPLLTLLPGPALPFRGLVCEANPIRWVSHHSIHLAKRRQNFSAIAQIKLNTLGKNFFPHPGISQSQIHFISMP